MQDYHIELSKLYQSMEIQFITVYQLKRKELGLSGEKASELLEAATGTNWTD